MNKLACQYALIRFLPYPRTGEFVNVGVVLACPAAHLFVWKLLPTQKRRRVFGLFEQLDVRIWRHAMSELAAELSRLRWLIEDHAGADPAFVQRLFAGLVQPRESLLRFGETRAILSKDPAATLHQLHSDLVERDFADRKHHDPMLERQVRGVLEDAGLRNYFKQGEIGDENHIHIRVPFLASRGGNPRIAIKPIDLGKAQASDVYDAGASWVGRIKLLERQRLLPATFLLPVRLAEEAAEGRTREAGVEMMADLNRIAGAVQAVPVTDATAIEQIARHAMH